MKILNFGSMNLDYVYRVEHFVQPGETLAVLEQKVGPGGKGFMPVEGVRKPESFGSSISRVPLFRGDSQITRNDCFSILFVVESRLKGSGGAGGSV